LVKLRKRTLEVFLAEIPDIRMGDRSEAKKKKKKKTLGFSD